MITPGQIINGYLPQAQGSVESAPQFSANHQGVLGANPSYGAMQGYLAAKDEMRAENKDNREERVLGMAEEKFGWDREAHQREQLIQTGMQDAAQAGGYEGVIAFLQKNDPERALKFQDAKLDLDSKIMTNDVMKNIKIPSMQQDALLESYSKLGQMGAAILKAPAQDRETMYQHLLPIAKVINPEMPDNLQQAAPMLLLAAAQATPANQFFKNSQLENAAHEKIGQLELDYQEGLKAGLSPDNPSMVANRNTLKALNDTAVMASAKAAQAAIEGSPQQQSQDLKIAAATDKVSTSLEKTSKDTMGYMESYVKANSAIKTLQNDPGNVPSQMALGLGFIKAAGNVGALSDQEQQMKYSAAGFPSLLKKLHGMVTGTKQDLNASEIAYLNTIIQNQAVEQLKLQHAIESQYKSTFQGTYANTNVKWENVRLPSKALESYMYGADMAQAMAKGLVPAELQEKANKALAAGVPADKVSALVMKKMQEAQKQTTPPVISPNDYAPTPTTLDILNSNTVQNYNNAQQTGE